MATRRAYLYQETGKETKILPEDTVEADGIIDNHKEVKKVTFSSENEVFEFTRSVKIRKRKNVRPRFQVPSQELRRSKRNVGKGITVAESNEDESNTRRGIAETAKECSLPDVKVPRRSKRIACSDHKDPQDDHKVENVPRRSKRLVNDIDVHTNTQNHRRSLRFKASSANPSMRAGTKNDRSLCSAKLREEKRKTKQSKGSTAVNCQEGELVQYNKMEPLTDCEVQKTETHCKMKVQGVSKVEMVPRRSKRIGNNVNVLMDKRPLVGENLEAVKRDDLELEKAETPSIHLERNSSELLVDSQAQKSDKQPKRTGNDREHTKLLRRSKRIAVNNMLDQVMSNFPKRWSVIHCERDQASVDNVDDEMQVHAGVTQRI